MELNEGFMDTSISLPTWEQTDQEEYCLYSPEEYETILALDTPVESPEVLSPEADYFSEWPQTAAVELVVDTTLEAPAPFVPVPVVTTPEQELSLTLFQKRRGTGGLWQPVTQSERIRVDKSKGKLVRLYAKSNKANIGEEGWSFQIYLVDKARPEFPILQGDGFTIEPIRPAKGNVDVTGKEFKLKLTKISKNQYFLVTASCGNVQLSGCTLEFRSDDNGKVLNSKKRPRCESSISNVSTGPLAYRDICADNDLVNLIARSLVPVILDNFQAQLASGNLEDSIAKRIRLAFNHPPPPPPLKCEV
jgi:hypothetical protein